MIPLVCALRVSYRATAAVAEATEAMLPPHMKDFIFLRPGNSPGRAAVFWGLFPSVNGGGRVGMGV